MTATDGATAVQVAVFTNRLESVIRRMTNTLFRTARSGVINSARDFSCCILTADDELLASAESLPIHVMVGPDLVTAAVRRHHTDLRRGDAYLHNSPYEGNSHAADHCIVVPVFDADERHRFTVVVKAHQADCGNALPTTYDATARDVYAEGALIFSAVRVQSEHVVNDDVVRMCRNRIRVPEVWEGDFRGMLAAARIGEQELELLLTEVPGDDLDRYVRSWFDYSEARMREAIAAIPSGTHSACVTHDAFEGVNDEVPITATVTVVPADGRMHVDLQDNPDCLPCGLNLTESTAIASALIGVFNSLVEEVPANAGSFRAVEVALRDGCVVGRPAHPTSCSVATTNITSRLIAAVQLAIAELGSDIGMAESGPLMPAAAAVISGTDPRRGGAAFVNMLLLGTPGGGASAHSDGWLGGDSIGAGLIYRDSVEAAELMYPIRVWRRAVEPDSEGAGRYRGSPSIRVEFGSAGGEVTAMWCSDGAVHAARGARGGTGGAPAEQYVLRGAGRRREELPGFGGTQLQQDDVLVSLSAAGGGFGDPQDRAPEAVRHDVTQGLITIQRAMNVYGLHPPYDPYQSTEGEL